MKPEGFGIILVKIQKQERAQLVKQYFNENGFLTEQDNVFKKAEKKAFF